MFFKSIDPKKVAKLLPNIEQPFLNKESQNLDNRVNNLDFTDGNTSGCTGTNACQWSCSGTCYSTCSGSGSTCDWCSDNDSTSRDSSNEDSSSIDESFRP